MIMNIDEYIKSALKNNVRKVSPKEDSLEKIKSRIELNRSELYMSRKRFAIGFNIRRAVIVTCCSALVICGGLAVSPNGRRVIADTLTKFVYGYSEVKHYDKAQKNADLTKDAGFDVKVPSELLGGYKLIDTDISQLEDGSSGKIEKKDKKELGAMYSKEKADSNSKITKWIGLTEYNHELDALKYKNIQKVNIGEKTAYFREYTSITYRSDVKPTEKDWDDQKDGKAVIVAVSGKKGNENIPEKTTKEVRELSWTDNGVNYTLTEEGYELNLKELSNIADGIMNSK